MVAVHVDLDRGRTRLGDRWGELDLFAASTLAARIVQCRQQARACGHAWDAAAVASRCPHHPGQSAWEWWGLRAGGGIFGVYGEELTENEVPTDGLTPVCPSEILEAFHAGDGVDLIRESVRVALQQLIELEATDHIGAAPHEPSEDRTAERNGHRSRTLTTKAGNVELRTRICGRARSSLSSSNPAAASTRRCTRS